MRRTTILATLALAATSVAAAAIEPGEWRSTTQMSDIALPGDLPPQVMDMMRRQMGQAMSNTQCITQQDIDEAPEQMFEQSDGDCSYSDFDMSGGSIAAVAVCNTEGGRMTMTMDGSYTDTTYVMEMRMQGDMGMGPMTMTYSTTGERVGACS